MFLSYAMSPERRLVKIEKEQLSLFFVFFPLHIILASHIYSIGLMKEESFSTKLKCHAQFYASCRICYSIDLRIVSSPNSSFQDCI